MDIGIDTGVHRWAGMSILHSSAHSMPGDSSACAVALKTKSRNEQYHSAFKHTEIVMKGDVF